MGDGALLVVPVRADRTTGWRNLGRPSELSVLRRGRWQPADGEAVMPGDTRHVGLAAACADRWPRSDVADEPVVRIVLERDGARPSR